VQVFEAQKLRHYLKRKTLEKVGFIFEKGLDFSNLLRYCCVLTGGAIYKKYDKRAMARKPKSKTIEYRF